MDDGDIRNQFLNELRNNSTSTPGNMGVEAPSTNTWRDNTWRDNTWKGLRELNLGDSYRNAKPAGRFLDNINFGNGRYINDDTSAAERGSLRFGAPRDIWDSTRWSPEDYAEVDTEMNDFITRIEEINNLMQDDKRKPANTKMRALVERYGNSSRWDSMVDSLAESMDYQDSDSGNRRVNGNAFVRNMRRMTNGRSDKLATKRAVNDIKQWVGFVKEAYTKSHSAK